MKSEDIKVGSLLYGRLDTFDGGVVGKVVRELFTVDRYGNKVRKLGIEWNHLPKSQLIIYDATELEDWDWEDLRVIQNII